MHVTIVLASGLLTALGVPALLACGGLVVWVVRSTIEDYRDAERQLTDQRRELYRTVLEPFIQHFLVSDDDAETAAKLQEELFASPEYKRALFELTLYASDDVVKAFGDVSNIGTDPNSNAMVLWARLLFAIRKSVGNKGTRLTPSDLLRTTINDVDSNPELIKLVNEPRS
jgi:hypothetical protein